MANTTVMATVMAETISECKSHDANGSELKIEVMALNVEPLEEQGRRVR